MKKLLSFFAICCLFSTSIFAQYKYNPQKPKTNHPIGTVEINENLYIDHAPVSNLMYLEFLGTIERFYTTKTTDSLKQLPLYGVKPFDLERYGPFDPKFLIAMSLNKKHDFAGKKLSQYFEHPKYAFHPVLFINKEQAEMFCKWRSDMAMLYWSVVSKTAEERSEYPSKVNYRLPTKAEYRQALQFFKNEKKLKVVEDKMPYKPSRFSENNIDKTAFYVLNISEYTLDSEPVGDNWRESADFPKENDFTGFRCICEVEW